MSCYESNYGSILLKRLGQVVYVVGLLYAPIYSRGLIQYDLVVALKFNTKWGL